MNWYVLRVNRTHDGENESNMPLKSSKDNRTSEERVLAALQARLDKNTYKPFIPMKIYPHVKKGRLISEERKICFPGYVFIETEKDSDFVVEDTRLIIGSISEAHFLLYYEDNSKENGKLQKREYAMRENEILELKRFMNDDFIMESSTGFMDGDRVKITSGAFLGQEGLIKKVDRRRKTATIEADVFGRTINMTIMLDIAEKNIAY